MDEIFSKLNYELLEESRRHAHQLVAVLHVSSDPRKNKGHTCPMSIVVMDKSAAMHIGQQLLRLPPLKESAKPHATSTTPEHAQCLLCPDLCRSSLGGPQRVCV
jgi:hypothetical protein